MSHRDFTVRLLRDIGVILIPVSLAVALSIGLFSLFWYSSAYAERTAQDAYQDLWIGLHGEPATLDPSRSMDRNTFHVSSQIYDTLVSYQSDGSLIEPGLAISWTISEDGLIWNFYLRPGVQFHDGTDLDANAVVYNLERWWDPDHPHHTGDFEYFNFFFSGYKGDPECLISNISAIGNYQVQIQLSRPFSPLPNMLAIAPFGVASPTAIQAGTLITHPVGSGPFKFQTWETANHIQLAANTGFWDGSPYMENIVFKFTEDPVASLVSREVQVVDGIGGDDAIWAASDRDYHLMWEPQSGLGYLGMNRGIEPLDDLLVRQAVAHAANKPQLLNDHYPPGIQQADQILPPNIFGHNPDLVDYTYDPALSQSLLNQAGYTNGVTVTLSYRYVSRIYLPNPEANALAVGADLEAALFNITVVGYDNQEFFSKFYAGELELFLLGWIIDYLHPHNYLDYHSCGDGSVAFGPQDSELCSSLSTALESTDFETQLAIYQSANQRVFETLPLLPLVYTRQALISEYTVEGVVPSPIGMPSYKDAHYVEVSQVLYPGIGGELVYTDTQTNTTTVIVPAEAVTDTVLLRFAPSMDGEPPSEFSFINHSFTLEASQDDEILEGFTFQEPVSITIEYSDEDVLGIKEETLLLYYWDGSSWVDAATTCDPPSIYSHDPTENVLSVSICHLSHFAVLGVDQHKIYLPLILRNPQD